MNPLLWRDRRKAGITLWRTVGLVLLLLGGYHVLARLTALIQPQSDQHPLFEPLIWASLGLTLIGAVDDAMRDVDEHVARKRLELLWSTPVLQKSLTATVALRGPRWLLKSGAWAGWVIWSLGPAGYGPAMILPHLLSMLFVGVLLAALGGLLGTLVAIRWMSRGSRWTALALMTLPLVAVPAGLDAELQDPSGMLARLLAGYAVMGLWEWVSLARTTRSSMATVQQAEASFQAAGLYRLLDRALRAGARVAGVDRDPFFRLHRARALRRFGRQPWLVALALLPLAAPLVLASALHTSVAMGVTVLAFPICFAWWLVGNVAAEDALRLEPPTLEVLRLVPFDARFDTVAIIWGRLYPVALAWLINLPGWLLYSAFSDAPTYMVLLIPALSGLLCFGLRRELDEVRQSLQVALRTEG